MRTFDNYFTGKYDALAHRQTERLRRSIAALRDRPAEGLLWRSIAEAVISPLEEDFRDATGEENKIPSRTELAEIRKVLMRTEIRDAADKELFDEWLEVVAERTGTDPDRDIYPRLVPPWFVPSAMQGRRSHPRRDVWMRSTNILSRRMLLWSR